MIDLGYQLVVQGMAHWQDADRVLARNARPAVAIATDEQIAQIHKSFDSIWPLHREITKTFYQRFFELVPDARRMFPDEMDGRRRKLMGAIAALVGTLDHPEMFRPVGSAVDRWHGLLGVTSSHLAPFADALLWTLERHFVASSSPALRQAWAALCEALRSDIDIPSGRHRISSTP
jgi:hemoglobin-like flavoprotein